MKMASTRTCERWVDVFGRNNLGPSGHIVIVSPGEATLERETLRCVHCGRHWVRVPGSGAARGFCMRCKGVTCGAKACDPCVPYEVRVEIEEGTRGATVAPYLDDYERATGRALER